MPLLLITFLPVNRLEINFVLAIIFLGFSVTDFLDGYLARHFHQETALGKLLDPIADKFLVYSTLIDSSIPINFTFSGPLLLLEENFLSWVFEK